MFKRIKKRSTESLLKAAKKLNNEVHRSPSKEPEDSSFNSIINVVDNKRSHAVPEYVGLSPSEFMQWWITSTGAKRKSSNYLLHYLKFKFNLKIPSDYRTLLKTPIKPVPMNITPGSYIHIGLRQALHHLISEGELISSSVKLIMQFFVDGLTITKSTKEGLWIIMTNIRNASVKRLSPKVIGVYYGRNKPEDFNEFLWPFVMELLDILEKGIHHNEINWQPQILNFVLDAPARTSCKAVKHINGYFGCDYCLVEGDCIDHRMAFLELDAQLRTDVDYRSRVYEDYHHKESVLEMLPVDMIDSFPPDYLHCLLLGTEKWILQYIRDTSKLLSSNDYTEIKRRVDLFLEFQPIEFQRKLRPFTEELGVMKGTEFRQYVLFIGPLLFKGILNEQMTGNLMKLQIASTIFSHKRFACYNEEADQLMRMFVTEFAQIYHHRHVVYVVHSLIHMRKFVDMYGSWDNFSTFEYESYNSSVKNLLKGNIKPLTQLTNRIVEIYNAPTHDFTRQSSDIEVKGLQENGTYSQLKYYDLTFNVNVVGQDLVLLKSGQGVMLLYILIDPNTGKLDLIGKPFITQTSVFGKIVDTTRFNIFKSMEAFGNPVTFDVDDIDGKLWKLCIKYSDSSAYYPIYVEDGKSFSRKQ